MGCGSSRNATQVGNHDHAEATKAEDNCNAHLSAHLSTVLGIDKASTDVARYVMQLRSHGCDRPEDMDSMSIDELAEEPFNFKVLHLTKVTRSRQKNAEASQADAKRSDTLAAYFYSILGEASEDVARYVTQLRSQGYNTPEDINYLSVEELARKPFNFKSLHVKKVRTACLSSTCACVRAFVRTFFL